MLLPLRLTCLRGSLAATGLLRLFRFLVSLNGSTRATTGQRAVEDHCSCQEPSPARVCGGGGKSITSQSTDPWHPADRKDTCRGSHSAAPPANHSHLFSSVFTHTHTQAIKIPKVDVSLSIIHRKCLFLQNWYWNYQITNTVWTVSTSEITNWSNFFKLLEK